MPHVCPDCRGPSSLYRGHIHLWRCRRCVDAVVLGGDDELPPPLITEFIRPKAVDVKTAIAAARRPEDAR